MTKLVSKKVLVPAALAVVAVALVVLAVPQAIAASSEKDMAAATSQMPKINGTVSVGEQTRDFINDNLKVTLSQASETAAGEVDNGVVVAGHLGVVQGYLVYTFHVVNPDDQTKRMVIVDAGNGEALFTSEPGQMGSFGPHGQGHWKGGGFGGPWHGFGGGMWHQGFGGMWHNQGMMR
jgi:uncharacterized membrane protein YkoI